MINILLVLNIVVVVLLIGIILLQKSQGGVLGMGGSGSKNGLFTARSAGNFVTKLTYVLAAAFFIICIVLAALVSRREHSSFISTMVDRENVREVSTPSVKKIPEDEVKSDIIKETVKDDMARKTKPQAPTAR